MKKHKLLTIIGIACATIISLGGAFAAYADGQFSVSPMNQKIVLTPGEVYRGSFKVTNPATNDADFSYVVDVTSFYVDEDYELIYNNNGDYNQIVDWITIDNPEGSIAPNATEQIYFSVNVPSDAPAGGQYAAITVTSNAGGGTAGDGTLNINAKYSIAHIIYGEVTGVTARGGEVIDANVSSFLLSGNISGSASIKNTGNVHSTAKYILQVFPLFSNEEIYTNEEVPEEQIILPDRTFYHETTWWDTPVVGVFNVIYTVEFEGVVTQVSKMVIKCPIWLLFIIVFIIAAVIIWLVVRAKGRGKKKAREE